MWQVALKWTRCPAMYPDIALTWTRFLRKWTISLSFWFINSEGPRSAWVFGESAFSGLLASLISRMADDINEMLERANFSEEE
ncbi:hypothetical protein Goshw_014043 [Gossypium schwendimanii]|uniref:Uncharacterized protein n=1 Tax=Gossypium schwendimanii TaxID=34291 RepID=A0A7J9LVX0_GOSSC|nr:hypothetical protein [Gossypium schwendimanii]